MNVTRGRPVAGIVNGPKGRGQGLRRGADLEPFGLEQGPEQAGGAHFLEGQLGIGVDAPAQIEDPAAALLDGLGDPDIHIHRVPAPIIVQKENPCQKRGRGANMTSGAAGPVRDRPDPGKGRGATIMKSVLNALSVLVLGFGLVSPAGGQTAIKTAAFQLEIGPRGEIVKLLDLKSQKNYAPEGRPGCLVRVRTSDGRELSPRAVTSGRTS